MIRHYEDTAHRRRAMLERMGERGGRCYGALLWTWLDFFEATIAGVNLPKEKWDRKACPCGVCCAKSALEAGKRPGRTGDRIFVKFTG